MKKIPAAAVSLFVLSATLAFPQGSFLKKGQNGLGLSGAFATSSEAAGVSATAGFALGGVFELAFSAGRAWYDSDLYRDLKGTSLAPELRGHVIKQNSSRSPVSLSLSIGLARDSYSSPTLDEALASMWANSLLLGAALSRDVRLAANVYLQPYAGVGFTTTSFKIRDETTGIVLKATDDLVSLNLGLPLVYGISDRTLLVVLPGLALNKDNSVFSISAGLVLVLSKPGI